jgi:CheY-like chemotaxis protein
VRASSGAEALRRFQEARPVLAVIDIVMPDMDGVVVLEGIRRVDGEVPVILITGIVGESIVRQLEHYRRVAFFEKGSGLDRFVGLVNKTLGGPGEAGP